jgi:hypothetical protein
MLLQVVGEVSRVRLRIRLSLAMVETVRARSHRGDPPVFAVVPRPTPTL